MKKIVIKNTLRSILFIILSILAEILLYSGNSLKSMVKHFLFVLPVFASKEILWAFGVIYLCYFPFSMLEMFTKKYKKYNILLHLAFSILYVFILGRVFNFYNIQYPEYNYIYFLLPLNEAILWVILIKLLI